MFEMYPTIKVALIQILTYLVRAELGWCRTIDLGSSFDINRKLVAPFWARVWLGFQMLYDEKEISNMNKLHFGTQKYLELKIKNSW